LFVQESSRPEKILPDSNTEAQRKTEYMSISVTDNPFAILTLIAAPAVFTNASSVLALGTGNRLARVVDRTRELGRSLSVTKHDDAEVEQMWHHQLERLEKRGGLLVRAIGFFYTSIGAFAAASLVSILGASLAGSSYSMPYHVIAGISFAVGVVGFVGLSVGCLLLVRETRLALLSHFEEAKLIRSRLK
jgi:hypothetical protein